MKRASAFICLSVAIFSCTNPDSPPAREPVAEQPVAVPASTAPPAPTPPPVAAEKENVTVAVEYLINTIATSPLTFIRNGTKHTGDAASKHIRSKYNHFQKDIATAEDFIVKAATKSDFSGKPYLVQLENGTQIGLADWLTTRLAEWRASRPKTP